MENFKRKLNCLSGGKVLDVGTRYGEFIKVLKENLKCYTEFVGIDNDPKIIEEVKKKFDSSDIQFLQMDAENLKFQDNSFDTVCISNTLHHLPDVNKVLEEIKRVLKPGGLFIINEMFSDMQNECQLTHVYLHHLSADIDVLLGEHHYNTFKKQEIIDIVSNIGIDVVDAFEYFETDKSLNSKLATKIMSLDKKIEKTKGFLEYEKFKQRGNEVKERFKAVGVSRCTQLIVIGKK